MKVKIYCDNCDGEGHVFSNNRRTSFICSKCNTKGYIETEIPIEQCIDALKAERNFDAYCIFDNPTLEDRCNKAMELGIQREDAIKAAEAVLK